MQTYSVQAEFQGSYTRQRTRTRYLVVHHAAALYGMASGLDDVRTVDRYHKSKGWGGAGYHIALAEATQGGPIARYDLSDLSLARAGVAHRNHEALHISCLTNFTDRPAQKWLDALSETLRSLLQIYPNAEIVGHRDIAYSAAQSPDGLDWRTACPGPAWPTWRNDLLRRAHDRPLLGPPSGTAQQASAWLMARADPSYADDAVREIVEAYARLGGELGVDWFTAIAQMCHETGSLTSFWSLRPQRNPAGIGVNGEVEVRRTPGYQLNTQKKPPRWEKGLSFLTWADHAIPAHLGRLLAYALPVDQGTPLQRRAIDEALALRPIPDHLRGAAPTLMTLNGAWAVPGIEYGQRIAQLAQRIRRG